jgi:hypothetical protein
VLLLQERRKHPTNTDHQHDEHSTAYQRGMNELASISGRRPQYR